MQSLHRSFTSVRIVVCGALLRPGERLAPVYVAALDAKRPDRVLQIGAPKLLSCRRPPYPTGPQCLLVTINADELVACHLALDWCLPQRIIDLSVEFRNATNGARLLCGSGFVGALVWFGLPATDGLDHGTSPETVCRKLAALLRLYEAMQSNLDIGRALLRGRYMAAVARMEWVGISVDQRMVGLLGAYWPRLRARILEIVDRPFGVYEHGRFQPAAFQSWLGCHGIQWPRAAAGDLDLSDEAFRDMTRVYPELRPLKELRSTLAGFVPSALSIGRDGRNRTPLRPFASRTGRNQPSSKASVLGTAAWIRNLARPAPGMGLAFIDWSQQEFGIAAALSGDKAMMKAYATGDPYLALAIRAGAAPQGASCATHTEVRDRFKACSLGVQYGMGTATLARMIKATEATAQELLGWHRQAFPDFWRWSETVEFYGVLGKQLESVFGWRMQIGPDSNPRFLRNYPMQANGAEMLRLACCLVTEAQIRVCMPIHDALLIEARLDDLDTAIVTTERLMAEASRVVLDGFELRTKARSIRHPQRLGDDRGQPIWRAIEQACVEDIERNVPEQPVHKRDTTRTPASTRPIYLYGSKEEC